MKSDALELVQEKLAQSERLHPVHNMQVKVTEEELALRDRLVSENGWTARETQVFALKVLDALIKEAKT